MRVDVLQGTVLFRGMAETEIREALDSLGAFQRSYSKGEAVLHAGSTTRRIGLVLSGSVTVESNDMWGNRTVLDVIGRGEFFAETYAFLRNEPLLVDVAANEDSRVLFLEIGSLAESAAARPWQVKLLGNLLTITAHKNLALSGRAFHTAPKTARGRILAYLNSVSVKKHAKEFDIPFDRQQMADYLSLERTALSKELGRMRREGIIAFRKNRFTIL